MSDTPAIDSTTEAPPSSSVAVAEPPAAAPAAPPVPRERRKVQVPLWLLAVLAAVVLAVGAFFVGRSTAPDTSGPSTLAEAVEETASGDMEVGEFNVQDLIAALQQNGELNIGSILEILGNLDNR